MAGKNLGNAYVTIMPSAKGISGKIQKAIDPEARSAGNFAGGLLGNNLASTLMKTLAAAGIGIGIKKFFSDALAAGGALQQSFGGLDTIYGEAAAGMKDLAYEAAQAGISANTYAEQAVSFGASLKQAYGGDMVAAANAANTAILDMADNSAKMGTDIQSIQNAYQGFAKQNYTMLDNLKLGYGGTKTEMERLLKDATALTGVKYDISNLGDVYEAIHVMQGELGLTGVAAQEGAETFTGSMAAMKASAQNLLANLALGQDIKKPLKSLIGNTKAFLVNNMFPMIRNIVVQLPTLIGEGLKMGFEALSELKSSVEGYLTSTVIPAVSNAMKKVPGLIRQGLTWAFNNVPGMVDTAIGFINNLANGISAGSGAFREKAAEIGRTVLSFFSEIGAKVGEILKAIDWVGLGKSIINLLWTGIQALAPVIWDGLKYIGNAAWEAFKKVDWKGLGSTVLNLLLTGIKNLGHLIWDGLAAIGRTATQFFENVDWENVGRTVMNLLISGIKWLGSTLWNALKSIGDTAGTKFKGIDWKSVGLAVIRLIVAGFHALTATLWGALKQLGETAWEKFKAIDWKSAGLHVINTILKGLEAIGANIWNTLKTYAKTAWENIKTAIDWKGAGKAIIDFIVGGLAGFGLGIWNKIREGLASAQEKAKQYGGWGGVGRSIVEGVQGGINSKVTSLATTAANMVKAALASARWTARINSPSKLFAEQLGEPISEGIAYGINNGSWMIDDALKDVLNDGTEIDAGSMYKASGVATATASSGVGSDEITINVYPSAGMNENQLADMVQQRLATLQRQKMAAWGTA